MTVNIAGAEIRFSFSFALVLTLMLLFCRQDIVLICTASSMLHECGHLIFMKIFGEGVMCVDFGAFGVRIERQNKQLLSYKKECFIALGGIIINFLLAFLSIIYYYLMKSQQALMFSLINIFIAGFNCVPIAVLDMGRALKCRFLMSYDEDKSERLLGLVSLVFVNFLAVFCCVYTAFISVNFSLIAVTAYLYVITLFKKWS